MSCEELRDMYELYALGVLEQPERAEIDAHLGRGCDTCTSALQAAIATNACIFTVVPDAQPPARLKKKVLAGIGVEKGVWSWMMAWGALSACLLIGLLWISIQHRHRVSELAAVRRELMDTTTDLEKVRDAMTFLNEPDTQLVVASKAVPLPPKSRVFINQKHGVLLMANNLPPAPSGKIYEMWVIPKGGAPRPAGLFQSDASGNAIHLLAGPVDIAGTAAVAVTVEPAGGSPAPTTTPFLVTAL